jgi:hypothetical protein
MNLSSHYHTAAAFLPLLHKAAGTVSPNFVASVMLNAR